VCGPLANTALAARIIDHRDNVKLQDIIDNLGVEPYIDMAARQGSRSLFQDAPMIFELMEPNPYDTVETWERFLAQLRQMPDQDDLMLANAIAHAEKLIELKRLAS
jgi:hypothetical protein